MTPLQQRIASVVNSRVFERFILAVILINAAIIGLETYPEFASQLDLFHFINNLILGIFVVEIILKLAALYPKPQRYFFDRWNVFDFAVVAVSLIPTIGPFASVARITRLLRTLRIISQFKDLRVITSSLVRSIPSVLSILTLMFLIFYIYGVIGQHFFHDVDPARWGTLGKSILTLFSMMTLEGWDRVMYSVLEMFPLAWVYFVSFIVISAFMIVNLFVGVMLFNVTQIKEEETGEYAREKIMMDEIKEVKQMLQRLEKKMGSRRK